MIILDGKSLSAKIKDELKCKIDGYVQKPVLAVISIGNNASSEVYINSKKKACEYVGMSFLHIHFDTSIQEKKIISRINALNKDKNINGIIVQIPIPSNYDKNRILNSISETKDVDGLKKNSMFTPCTVLGVIKLLEYYKIDLSYKNVAILGRSDLVGKPLAIECLKKDSTVSICHSKTKDLKFYTKNADIIMSAVGKKYLIDKSMIKKDCTIIDIGITREDSKVYGDVNPNVEDICYALSPVPGGVGPMTVVMLLSNVFYAYTFQNGIKDEK